MSDVLLIDDDPAFVKSIAVLFRRDGHRIDVAATLDEARGKLAAHRYDLALVDLNLPDGSGLEIWSDIYAAGTARLVVVTGEPTLDSAMHAINAGVVRYMQKPVHPQQWQDLLNTLAHASEPARAQMLGQSPAMLRSIEMLDSVARTELRVLLTGESGTGKDLAARWLHEASGRKGAFVALNCGAVAPELLASQLFGHERGSFTGAHARHAGVFEQAAQGTLFLDEIAEMRQDLQVFLLRTLETQSIVRVGGGEPVPVDVRVVAATNRDPSAALDQGGLREDLYYRLAEFEVHLPALRDREGDAVILAAAFIDELNLRHGKDKFLLPASNPALLANAWRGNVRELRSAVHQAYLMQEGPGVLVVPKCKRHSPNGPLAASDSGVELGATMDAVKRHALLRTLEHCQGDKTAAARVLGISVRTVHNELARMRKA